MNEEDEAFEDLAKRQGDWGMQGSRKHQIMRYAENVENKGTSMTDKEAMRLALDALETLMIERGSIYEKAITALKERLAQPEPIQSLQCFHCQVTIETLNDKVMQLMAQRTEQEPVAWQFMNGSSFRKRRPDDFFDLASDGLPYWRPLYTAPPQRTWVGLTDEEKGFCAAPTYVETVARIEAKLKEKNT